MTDEDRRRPLPHVVLRYATGLPDDTGTRGQQPFAAWGDEGELLVVTWGSSRCPELPVTLEVPDPNTVTVTTRAYRPGGPCTRDYVPTTAVLRIPPGLDETSVVHVRVGDVMTELAPR